MKIKFLPILVIFLFLVFFLVFFQGLKNSNIYTPNMTQEKKIPFFAAKLFDSKTEKIQLTMGKMYRSFTDQLMSTLKNMGAP